MTSQEKKVFEWAKVRLAMIVGAISVGSAFAGGVGATFTFKVTSEMNDKKHDESIVDHEGRIKSIEASQTDRLARIEEIQREVNRRMDRFEVKIDKLLEGRK